MTRVATAILGVLALLFGAAVLSEESTRGFPDGHLTEYDRFVQGPSRAAGTAALLLGALAIAAAARALASRRVVLVAIAILFAALVGIELVVLPALGSGLDDGRGG